MKKTTIAIFCLCLTAIVANGQDKKTTVSTTTTSVQTKEQDAGKFKFREETHDYGEVKEGPNAECDFEFVNEGNKPINIAEAHGSCGCTVPKWPLGPIAPGKSGKIHVSYTTMGHEGAINKTVTVTSDAQQSPMVLHIKGFVIPKPAEHVPQANVNGK